MLEIIDQVAQMNIGFQPNLAVSRRLFTTYFY